MRLNPTPGLVKRLALIAIPVLAVLLSLPGTTYAQRMTGELSGSVIDESGGVIPGADVVVTNEASGAVRRSVTNSDGFFAFSALPAATYTVMISITGFNSYEVKGVELRSGDSRSIRQVSLKVATMAETVSVSAEVALTPLNSGEKSATLTAEQIENIPIMGTSAAEVLRLLPGMTGTGGNNAKNSPGFSGEIYGINGNGEGGKQSAVGNYSANGARDWALDITIDGAPGADPGCNCATSVNPNTEFVQEFKVLQSNFGAEHAKGPVAMSVISKQGGREFHGSALRVPPRLPPRTRTSGSRTRSAPTASRTSSSIPASASAARSSSRAPTSTRTATRCSSSPASSTSARPSTPATSSPGCRPRRCATATSATPRPSAPAAR